MSNLGVRLVMTAIGLCVICACGGDDDDGGGGAGTAAGSGGSAGTAGSSGTSGGAGTAGGSGTSGDSGTSGGGRGGSTGGGAGGSSAGSGGSAGGDEDAGMDPTAGTGGNSGEGGQGGEGSELPRARATIAGFDGGSVTGTWTFEQDGSDVTVVIELENCPDGAHQVHIHEGTGCATEQAQGMHWGPTRGEGIPDVQCSGGEGTVTHTRDADPASTAWSIGGDASSDVVGHAVVVHEAGGNGRIGCGVIAEL